MKKIFLLFVLASFFLLSFAPGHPIQENMVQGHRIRLYLQQAQENRAKERTLKAIIAQESAGDAYAYNPKEDAAGILQIRPIMIKEANRIAGYEKDHHCDRWDRAKSIEIFWLVQDYWQTGTDAVQIALLWNTGSKEGWANKYCKSVLKHMEKQKD